VHLQIDNISKSFRRAHTQIFALQNCCLSVAKGEFICIIGPSGCGKSTLLNLVAGLDRLTSGFITINGKKIIGPGPDRALMFQEPALLPWLKVIDNVEFGLKMSGCARLVRKEKAYKLLELMKMTDFASACIHELSGGMKQRVAIARTFAMDADLMLLDEPFSALDNHTRHLLQNELLSVWGQTAKTVLFVTHSPEEAYLLADRVVLMSNRPGKVCKEIKLPSARPRSTNTSEAQGFFAEINFALRDEVERVVEKTF